MRWRNMLCLLIILALLCGCAAPAEKTRLEEAAAYLVQAVPEPECGSVGGEWTVLALARAGVSVPEDYFDGYYDRLCQRLLTSGGVLSARKNTEYSRVILALTAIGKDPADTARYNLLLPLADFERTTAQGINGSIWALIALDAGGYEIPQTDSGTQATREAYLQTILDAQSEHGAWGLAGGEDVDMTAMALQALAKYMDRPEAASAAERALDWLSAQQRPNGAYVANGEENSESAAQVVLALCELGISLDDSRFVKNGSTLLDVLERFSCADGSFRHTLDTESNLMATEQCLCALAAAARIDSGQSSLYRMR